MKKLICIALLTVLSLAFAYTQNIQLHHDFRHSLDPNEVSIPNNYTTLTFEWFGIDRWGETFFFVDVDLNGKHDNIQSVYLELSRKFNLGSLPIQALIEYNGGLGQDYPIENAYLVGAAYTIPLKKNILQTYLAYRLTHGETLGHNVQWTTVWDYAFAKKQFTFCGYIDVWSIGNGSEEKKPALLTEPQIWWNITPHFAIGSEIRISYNFAVSNRFKCYPTAAIKYTFNP